MSNLQKLILEARNGLSVQERIPDQRWREIAPFCGPAEIAEIEVRIQNLQAELKSAEEWDGGTQDDINLAIYKFKQLLDAANPYRAKPPN
ncbi:hypothetical protein ACOQNP_04820 [Ectopseudomonas khazarica]|uniref:hypothetical protein n=1 Tax=Ectopseudomonas khazarica TaxID=2502979 RepID=UPI0009E0953E